MEHSNLTGGAVRESPPRRLGAFTGIAIVVGIIIGSGIFRVPAITSQHLPSVGWILAVWTVGGLISLAGALSVSELSAMYPEAGGLYIYLREAFGPGAAFVFGWMWLITSPASWAAQSVVFAAYLASVVPMSSLWPQFIAAGLVIVVAALQYVSVKSGAVLQNISMVAKMGAIVVLSVVLFALGGGSAGSGSHAAAVNGIHLAGFGVALISVLWAYDGWENLTALSGEIKRPGRNLPLALILGTVLVIAAYLLINAAFLHVLSPAEIAHSPSVAVTALGTVAGASAKSFIAAMVMVSVIGSLNGSTMSDPRVFFAMAEDGLFFASVGRLHKRFRTPHIAIAMTAALTLVFIFWRSFQELAEAYVLGVWPFLALATVALFRLRRTRPGHERPYRALGYPFVPALFVLASAGVMVFALIKTPVAAGLSFGFTLLGIPLYYLWRFMRRRTAVR
ncbi:MAG: amino acid permease [Gammaproteobacteria bacterium]